MSINNTAGEARLAEAAKEFKRCCKGDLQNLDDAAFAQVLTTLAEYLHEAESSASDSASDISKETSLEDTENDFVRVKKELNERFERGSMIEGSEVFKVLTALGKKSNLF